jgi:hypothetical protein
MKKGKRQEALGKMPFFLPGSSPEQRGGSRAGGRPVRGARRRPVRGGVRWIGQNGEGAEGVLFLCSP